MSRTSLPSQPASLPIATPRAAFAAVRPLLVRRPVLLMIFGLAGIGSAIAGLVAPFVLGLLVDALLAQPRPEPVVEAAVAVVVAAVVGAALTALSWRILAVITESGVAELREDAVDRALALDAAVVERAGPGDLVSRVAEDSRLIAEASSYVLPQFVASGFAVAVSAVGLLGLDWRLGLVGLVAIPMYALSLRWYLPRSGPMYVRERAAFGARAGHLLGGITGARTLRAYGAERGELDRIDRSSAVARDLSIDVFRMLTRMFGRNNRAEAVVLGLLLGAGFCFVLAGWVSAGAVATAALLFHRLFNPLGALVGLFDEVQSAGASLTRLVGVAQAPVPDRDPALDPLASRNATADGREAAAAPADAAPVVLAAEDVSHHYVAGQPVLRHVSVTVPATETVALVGSTGAGKTTLAGLLAGNLDATSGRCTLAGVPLRSLAEPVLRRAVCLVSQEVHTFAGSLRDDLTVARADATDAEVWDALRATHAEPWVRRLPDGLQTRVGDGGHRLTVVQAQQLALTRVLVADPAFVVLDEATAEAGSSGARELEAAATAVVAGRGALVVAHRLSQARLADRILVMEHGEIVEEGGHDALVARGGRYAELWAAWADAGR